MNESNRISILVEEYLRYKHSIGFQLKAEAFYLRTFAKYAIAKNYDGPLTRTIVLQWCESGDNPSLITKGRRFEPLVGLAAYACAFDHEAELLPHLPFGNPHKRIAPHIYTLEEACRLMEKCKELYSPNGIRSLTMETAIGLLWATGLRTSELVGLTNRDIDLIDNIIMVRQSKFKKDRLVPISQDVASELQKYQFTFTKIRDCVNMSDSGRDKARLYDFRHSFATRTIKNWLELNENANEKLFLLSTYLGHSHPEDTFWYLSATPELMSLTSSRYEALFGGDNDV